MKLSWWEEFIIGAALSFLTMLVSKVKSPIEVAGLQATISFLQGLMNGTAVAAAQLKEKEVI